MAGVEKIIESAIMDWLDAIGAYVIKINSGGKPIKVGDSVRYVPFMNKYTRKGMSDIFAMYNGKMFVFEVKTPTEHKYIIRHLSSIRRRLIDSKKAIHIYHQLQFLDSMRKQGAHGDFVSSLEQVRMIIENAFQKRKSKVQEEIIAQSGVLL